MSRVAVKKKENVFLNLVNTVLGGGRSTATSGGEEEGHPTASRKPDSRDTSAASGISGAGGSYGGGPAVFSPRAHAASSYRDYSGGQLGDSYQGDRRAGGERRGRDPRRRTRYGDDGERRRDSCSSPSPRFLSPIGGRRHRDSVLSPPSSSPSDRRHRPGTASPSYQDGRYPPAGRDSELFLEDPRQYSSLFNRSPPPPPPHGLAVPPAGGGNLNHPSSSSSSTGLRSPRFVMGLVGGKGKEEFDLRRRVDGGVKQWNPGIYFRMDSQLFHTLEKPDMRLLAHSSAEVVILLSLQKLASFFGECLNLLDGATTKELQMSSSIQVRRR